MESQILVGKRIKTFREIKKISIEEVAQGAGLPLETIEHIENESIMPTLSDMIKIARALGVRVGTFLDDHEHVGPVVNYAGQSTAHEFVSDNNHSGSKNMNYLSLSHNKAGRSMETFIIDVAPSTNEEHSKSAHEGEEFIYVLDGVVEIQYGKETYILNDGDSIYYDSVVQHHVHAAGDSPAKILAVVYAP